MADPAAAPSDLPDLVILGSGGHAGVLAEAAVMTGWRVKGYLGQVASAASGVGPWLGDDDQIEAMAKAGQAFAVGLGFVSAAGALRRASLLERLLKAGAVLPVIRHPGAIVSPSARLGAGVFVAAGAVVSTGAEIGAGALLNTASVADHGCRIGPNVHLATGARLAGDVCVGADALLGIGCAARQGVTIGPGAIVGAGAVVIRDVPAGATVLGCPAR